MTRLYTYLVSGLVRFIVGWCTARKRYVDYVHAGHTYMRRYVMTGFMTGDPAPRTAWARFRRLHVPNLYLHHMQAPDADECLHDHPWPWGLSFIVLGGYREERLTRCIDPAHAPRIARLWITYGTENTHKARWHHAPALNYIGGKVFHRVAELAKDCAWCAGFRRPDCHINETYQTEWAGVWTVFLAGPRCGNKSWGYLVPGRGYVHQSERHIELNAKEVRPT